MNIGLVGSGGREHALAKALARTKNQHRLLVFASGPNPGIEALADQFETGKTTDPHAVSAYFEAHHPDVVIIGPEAPLISGVADALRATGMSVVGPSVLQARLEGDKVYMRDLVEKKVGWGSPGWRMVTHRAQAEDFIHQVGEVAVKPVGLTAGKGVSVMGVHMHSPEEAAQEAERWIRQDGRVLLEERLVGEEFSRMALVSDGIIAPMPVAQDFKYAFDGDTGGMTGGMGAYTHADGRMPFLTSADLAEADRLMAAVVTALEADCGQPYRGFLYGQFMATARGPRLIEFNVRLGDPEAINVMALLEPDAPELFYGLANGKLDPASLRFYPQASVVKYLVPQEYPQAITDQPVFDLNETAIQQAGFDWICSSIARQGLQWKALGSRTLALVGVGRTPEEVSDRMEKLLVQIEPPALRHRHDVGSREVLQAKLEKMDRS